LSEAAASEGFRLPPKVTFANIVAVVDEGERVIRDDLEQPAVSLRTLEVSNSVAVALLLALFRRAHRMGKPIVFTDVPEDLLDIIEVSGLSEVLPLRTETADKVPMDKVPMDSASVDTDNGPTDTDDTDKGT
jgi:phospholipid transport system transporter-binding protein